MNGRNMEGRNKKKKLFHRQFKITAVFVTSIILIVGAFNPVFGANIEIASMSAHYKHPVTGAIEDSGKNEAIGQGMTESVLGPQALMETDDNGRIFITLRIRMANQLGSLKFAVQRRGSRGFSTVGYQVMQRGKDWIDCRIPLPAKNAVIRMDFFIKQMERNVIFYGLVRNLTKGNTNFKVSVNTSNINSQKQEEINRKTNKISTGTNVKGNGTSSGSMRSVNGQADETKLLAAENQPIEESKTDDFQKQGTDDTKKLTESGKNGESAIGYDHGLLTKDSPEIKKILGDDESKKEKDEASKPIGEKTRFMLNILSTIIGVLIAALVLSAIAVPVYYRMIRKRNNRREAMLYAKEDKYNSRIADGHNGDINRMPKP